MLILLPLLLSFSHCITLLLMITDTAGWLAFITLSFSFDATEGHYGHFAAFITPIICTLMPCCHCRAMPQLPLLIIGCWQRYKTCCWIYFIAITLIFSCLIRHYWLPRRHYAPLADTPHICLLILPATWCWAPLLFHYWLFIIDILPWGPWYMIFATIIAIIATCWLAIAGWYCIAFLLIADTYYMPHTYISHITLIVFYYFLFDGFSIRLYCFSPLILILPIFLRHIGHWLFSWLSGHWLIRLPLFTQLPHDTPLVD